MVCLGKNTRNIYHVIIPNQMQKKEKFATLQSKQASLKTMKLFDNQKIFHNQNPKRYPNIQGH